MTTRAPRFAGPTKFTARASVSRSFRDWGVARDGLRPGLRMMPSGNYVILYRERDETVDIVRVLDSRRKWQDLL